MNHYHKYLKYKKKYLQVAAAQAAFAKAASASAPAASAPAPSAPAASAQAASAPAETAPAQATSANCLQIYSNLGGTNGQESTIPIEYANTVNQSLLEISQTISDFSPDFLHIIFGGSCQGNQARIDNCLKRRFFMPYEIYYSDYEDSTDELAKQTILIIDPADDNTLDQRPFSEDDFDEDEIEQFRIYLEKRENSLQVLQLKNWVFAKDKNCPFNKIIGGLITDVVQRGGLVSIIDEIKAYAKPNGPGPIYIQPIIKYSLLYPESVLFISWQPKLLFNLKDQRGQLGLIIKKKQKRYDIPLNLVYDNLNNDKNRLFINSYSNYYLISITTPGSIGVSPDIIKEDKFKWDFFFPFEDQ